MDRAYARMSLATDRVDAFREDIRGIMRGKDVPTDVLILPLRDRPLHPSRTEVPFRGTIQVLPVLLNIPISLPSISPEPVVVPGNCGTTRHRRCHNYNLEDGSQPRSHHNSSS